MIPTTMRCGYCQNENFIELSGTFQIGDRVTKIKGSHWTGRVVGTYSTSLTPEGYCVESETEKGSVQIYPAAALQCITETLDVCPDCGRP